LGVLEHRKMTPLGTTEECHLDFKLVVATNRDLEAMVEEGTFRRDLYYRISAISFRIPPLRQRREDIPLLLAQLLADRHLTKNGEEPSVALVRLFMNYDWPGNTRELVNKVRRLEVTLALASDGDLEEVSHNIFAGEAAQTGSGSLFDQVERLEKQLLLDALKAAGGNKSRAARLLGVHEATVRTKLKRYGISLEADVA
jgi:transcriptional regulator with PAS, ATPase and Fis domain